MVESRILNDVKSRLDRLNIYELRQVARAVGVHRPADGKKSRVTEAILSIATGETAPEPPASRGAPPKSQQFDEQLVADIALFVNTQKSVLTADVKNAAIPFH